MLFITSYQFCGWKKENDQELMRVMQKDINYHGDCYFLNHFYHISFISCKNVHYFVSLYLMRRKGIGITFLSLLS